MKDTTKEDPLKCGGSLRPISNGYWGPGNPWRLDWLGPPGWADLPHSAIKIRQETTKN